MKLPESKLPWRIEEVNPNWSQYTMKDFDSWILADNTTYENVVPILKDAEYIIQSANHFPEAIRLLKEVKPILLSQKEEIKQFLTKLEEDEKDTK